ncbi:hypothetical protein FQA39_LY00173 [Lamprigera yunnana]|nr:hypothetical protein FQA39_LY00173 [Lamprigera yunnana]
MAKKATRMPTNGQEKEWSSSTNMGKEKYENMLEGVQPVESYLHRHLTEHLNAEVVLRTITDLSIALEWLTYSFLYIRAKKNPKHYGLPCGLTLTEIDKKLLGLCEYLSTMKNTFSALLNALILVKCFHTRLWENSPYVSKQLPGIGSAYSVTLAEADKTSFEALANTNPRDIERIINRKPPMGNEIRGAVEHLPNYKLDLTCLDNSYVDVKITLKNVELIKSHSSVKKESIMTLLVGDTDNCVLLHKSFKHSDFIQTPSVENRIKLADNYHEEISAHFISADWVGIDCQDSLTLPYNTTSKGSQEKKKPMEVSAGRSNGKKSPHIQMIVDKYFTKNKGTDGRNRKRQVKSNPPIESHDDADLVNITINNNCNFLQPGITEATALQTSIEESLKKCESNPNFLLTKSNTQFPKRTSYCPTPRRNVETNKSISTVTSQTENNLNKYKLPDMNDTLIFDSSLSLNEQNRNLDKFKVSSHTKFENVSSGGTLWCPSKNKNFYETTLNGEDSLDDEMSKMPLSVVGTPSNEPNGAQKSITWSSPLVISPTVKYSPAVGKSKTTSTTAFSYNDHYERFNVTDDRNLTDGSFTQKMLRPTLRDNLSTINCPLSDKDYYKHQREKDNSSSNDKELYEHLRDSIASTSFLETMNILKPTPTASYKKLSTTQKPRSVIDDYLKMMSTVTKEPKLGKDRPSQSKISAHTQTTISLPSTTKDASTSPIRTKQDEFLNIGSLKYYNVTNENKPFLGSNFETLPRQFLTDNRELFSNYEPYDDINISQNESVTCGNSYKSQTEINMPNEYLHPYWSNHSNVLRKSNSNFMGQSQFRNIKRENPFIDDSYSKRIRRGNTLRPLNNIVPVGAVRYPSVPGQLVGNFDRSRLDFSNDTNNTYQLRNQLQVQSMYANRIYNRNMAMVPNQNHDAYYNVRRNITTNAAGQPQRPLMNRRFMPVETFSNMSNPLFNDSISGIINAGLYEDLDEASEDLEM